MNMFILFQTDRFHFSVQKLDQQGELQSIVDFWTSLIRRKSQEFSFLEFIDQFVYPTICLLSGK